MFSSKIRLDVHPIKSTLYLTISPYPNPKLFGDLPTPERTTLGIYIKVGEGVIVDSAVTVDVPYAFYLCIGKEVVLPLEPFGVVVASTGKSRNNNYQTISVFAINKYESTGRLFKVKTGKV